MTRWPLGGIKDCSPLQPLALSRNRNHPDRPLPSYEQDAYLAMDSVAPDTSVQQAIFVATALSTFQTPPNFAVFSPFEAQVWTTLVATYAYTSFKNNVVLCTGDATLDSVQRCLTPTDLWDNLVVAVQPGLDVATSTFNRYIGPSLKNRHHYPPSYTSSNRYPSDMTLAYYDAQFARVVEPEPTCRAISDITRAYYGMPQYRPIGPVEPTCHAVSDMTLAYYAPPVLNPLDETIDGQTCYAPSDLTMALYGALESTSPVPPPPAPASTSYVAAGVTSSYATLPTALVLSILTMLLIVGSASRFGLRRTSGKRRLNMAVGHDKDCLEDIAVDAEDIGAVKEGYPSKVDLTESSDEVATIECAPEAESSSESVSFRFWLMRWRTRPNLLVVPQITLVTTSNTPPPPLHPSSSSPRSQSSAIERYVEIWMAQEPDSTVPITESSLSDKAAAAASVVPEVESNGENTAFSSAANLVAVDVAAQAPGTPIPGQRLQSVNKETHTRSTAVASGPDAKAVPSPTLPAVTAPPSFAPTMVTTAKSASRPHPPPASTLLTLAPCPRAANKKVRSPSPASSASPRASTSSPPTSANVTARPVPTKPKPSAPAPVFEAVPPVKKFKTSSNAVSVKGKPAEGRKAQPNKVAPSVPPVPVGMVSTHLARIMTAC